MSFVMSISFFVANRVSFGFFKSGEEQSRSCVRGLTATFDCEKRKPALFLPVVILLLCSILLLFACCNFYFAMVLEGGS